MTFGKRARCGLSRYPSESWDLWRQAPFHEALGPSFRWGDEKDRIPPGFGHQRRPGSIPTAAWPLCPDHGKFLPFGYRPQIGHCCGRFCEQYGDMTSALIRLPHICPSCGYAKLGSPPYANLKQLPVDESLQPPYSQHFGDPSYEVCACCGFEFGNDDDAGTRPPKTFREYRNEWIADGVPWFDGSKRPADWTLEQQLTAAGMVAFKGG